MASAHDVAAYVLTKAGPMSAMKLQKLVYYAKAWHLVWEDEPLFADRIEAWANGPVVRGLYDSHRGRFTLDPGDIKGDPDTLSAEEAESIDAVLDYYGDWSAHQLSLNTHHERPWRDARAGLGPLERGNAEITDAALAEFYEALALAEDEGLPASAES
jgi:uncharacterized phage-associated protein